MLVVYLFVCLLNCYGYCNVIPIPDLTPNSKLIQCVTDIVREHFAELKVITYIGYLPEDEELLKSINNAGTVSVVSKNSARNQLVAHEVYLITTRNATLTAEQFPRVTKESAWNPEARFLVVVEDLKISDIRLIFDTFLKLHARHVVVMNATDDHAHLYGYNPFDNYGCGKRYDNIINYGECSYAYLYDLYPEEIVTKLRNCTFNVIITQWPPYTILSSNDSDGTSPFRNGVEPYIFQLIGRMLGFKINVINDYSAVEEYPTVSTDMEAVGSLKKVQDNEADAALGGMLLTPSRALAFTYVHEHLAYTDEIRFVVKRVSDVPPWKNLYLEFESTVWGLLILALLIYSMFVMFLLPKKDKSYIVLVLLSNLVLHGRSIQSRWTVKCVLILWMWFAYLVNTFYQSGLVSLTTNPAQEFQISKEEDIFRYKLKPCFSTVMEKYYTESVEVDSYQKIEGCDSLMGSIAMVAKSNDLYTIMMNGQYQYNVQDFLDPYGVSKVITLSKPYSKVMYSNFLYKGFPMIHSLHQRSLLLREFGLVDKAMNDMNYLKQVKHHYQEEEFEVRFAIPWRIYIFGCSLAVVTFIVELNMPKKL